MRRVLLGNIVLEKDKTYMLINLVNFRRKLLDEKKMRLLENIEDKIQGNVDFELEEREILNELKGEKQVLSEELITNYEQLRMQANPKINKFHIRKATLNISYKCNFSCEYCYQQGFAQKETITEEKIDAIYDFIQKQSAMNEIPFHLDELILSGGEPLLRENKEILEYALAKFDGIASKKILFTNGTLLCQEYNAQIIEKIDHFQISIDGVDEIYAEINHYYQTDPLENVLEAINRLLKQENEPTVSISIILCLPVLLHLKELIEALENKGLLYTDRVSVYIMPVCNYRERGALGYKDLSEYLHLREVAKSIVGSKPIGVGRLKSVEYLSKIVRREVNKPVNGRISACDATKGAAVVFGPEGKFYWCLCQELGDQYIGQYYPDVRINESRVSELMNRSIYELVKCKECIWRYICGGGCPLSGMSGVEKLEGCCDVWNNQYFLDNMERFIDM